MLSTGKRRILPDLRNVRPRIAVLPSVEKCM